MPVGARWLALAVMGLVVLTADLTLVETGITTSWDRSLDLADHATFGVPWYGFFKYVSDFAGGPPRIACIAIMIVGSLFFRLRLTALMILLATGGTALLDVLLKAMISRPRPMLFRHAVAAGGSSFPSGHAANICAFGIVLVYLVWTLTANRVQSLVAGVAVALFVLLTGLSRVVLGVHYPTDVIGGYAMATAWVAAVIGGMWLLLARERARFGLPIRRRD